MTSPTPDPLSETEIPPAQSGLPDLTGMPSGWVVRVPSREDVDALVALSEAHQQMAKGSGSVDTDVDREQRCRQGVLDPTPGVGDGRRRVGARLGDDP